MAFWRKQIRVWFESSGSQTRVLFAKSTLFPNLIRTWFEQDSDKCLKKAQKDEIISHSLTSRHFQFFVKNIQIKEQADKV